MSIQWRKPTASFGGCLAGLAAVGLILRCVPLVQASGPLDTGSVIYDEGVYFGGAALLAEGFLPYRDYLILHPPGIEILLAPVAALGSALGKLDSAFVLARWLGPLVAVGNVVLVGVLARRWVGASAGLVAAALYATSPVAVATEAQILLEPYLILLSLATATVLLRPNAERPSLRQCTVAGLLCGLAIGVKLFGLLVLLACLVSLPLRGSMKHRLRLVAGAAAGVVVIFLPFAVAAGFDAVIEQVVLGQVNRPPAGEQSPLARAAEMAEVGPVGERFRSSLVGGIALLAAGLTAGWAWGRGGIHGRFWAAWLLLAIGSFLTAPLYYRHYAAFLAAPTAVLIAWVANSALNRRLDWPRALRAATTATFVAVPALSIVLVLKEDLTRRSRGDPRPTLRAAVPAGSCLYTETPAIGLSIGRLPARVPGAGILLSPFGSAHLRARSRAGSFRSADDMLLSPPVQELYRTALGACPYVVPDLHPGTHDRWSTETRAYFTRRYAPAAFAPGNITVWRRKADAGRPPPAPHSANGRVPRGDGGSLVPD